MIDNPACRKAANAILFTSLYNEHQHFVHSQVLRMTGSVWLAEETVQEVFLRVWQHRDQWPQIRDYRNWLTVITRRIVFSYTRHIHVERKYYINVSGDNTDPARILDAKLGLESDRLMEAALKEVTERQREAYRLRYFHGYKKEKVAQIMQISLITAGHHIKTAAARVKEFIYQKLEMPLTKRA